MKTDSEKIPVVRLLLPVGPLSAKVEAYLARHFHLRGWRSEKYIKTSAKRYRRSCYWLRRAFAQFSRENLTPCNDARRVFTVYNGTIAHGVVELEDPKCTNP